MDEVEDENEEDDEDGDEGEEEEYNKEDFKKTSYSSEKGEEENENGSNGDDEDGVEDSNKDKGGEKQFGDSNAVFNAIVEEFKNGAKEVTFDQIKSKLQIPDEEFQKQIQDLAGKSMIQLNQDKIVGVSTPEEEKELPQISQEKDNNQEQQETTTNTDTPNTNVDNGGGNGGENENGEVVNKNAETAPAGGGDQTQPTPPVPNSGGGEEGAQKPEEKLDNNGGNGDGGNAEAQKPEDQNQQGQGGVTGDPAQDQVLQQHARSTPSHKLREFIADNSQHPALKEVAKKELTSRGESHEEEANKKDGQEKGTQNPQADGGDQNAQKEKEIADWIAKYFDSHDISDLRAYTKGLIMQDPAKLKSLKGHYRDDYSKNNGGNRVDNIDDKDFDEWLDKFLAHLPFDDLKDYATKLLATNPEAKGKLQKKFESLNPPQQN